ncbi:MULTISPECIES: hypothetical protein [Bacteria]|uniref:hypothetical protein n=1 Tax=Bacteria TaxID=2 RepID=UPI003C7CF97F
MSDGRGDTPIHDVTPHHDPAPQPGQIRRRTIVKGAAWSVPVIAAAVAVPSAAASVVGTIRVVSAPSSTLACRPTTTAYTFRVTDELPTTVRFVFADGWGGRWAPGAPTAYPTDANGIVTIPAGDIIAGTLTSAMYAETAGGARGGSALVVRRTGTLRFGTGPANMPAASNRDFVRLFATDSGGVAVKGDGEIWRSKASDLPWVKIGDGADVGTDNAGFANFGGNPDAVWIKGGVLMWGTGLTNMPAASNSDFVRVYTSASLAIGIRSNGEIWRSDGAGMPWVKVGDGASTDHSTAAATGFGSPDPVWIKDGVLQRGSGPANLPAASNSGFIKVYGSDHGAVAIRANREIWRSDDAALPWVKIGDSASNAPDAAGYANYGPTPDAVWIQGPAGSLQWGTGPADMPAESNNGFSYLYTSDNGAVAVRQNGEIWRSKATELPWIKIGDGAFPEASSAGYENFGGGDAIWIQNTTSCD